jgi:hypothetical protein
MPAKDALAVDEFEGVSKGICANLALPFGSILQP